MTPVCRNGAGFYLELTAIPQSGFVRYAFSGDADMTAQTDPSTLDYPGDGVDTLNFDDAWFGRRSTSTT